MTSTKQLTIPRAEVDTFAASSVLNEAAAYKLIPRDYVEFLKKLAAQKASNLLAGETILTRDDDGNIVSVKLGR